MSYDPAEHVAYPCLHEDWVKELDEARAEIARLSREGVGVAQKYQGGMTKIDHLNHMANVRPAGPDRDAASWAIVEIARLRELLRGTGANRYWEGRWRDAEAEIARLRSDLAVEKINNKRLQSERNNAEAEINRLARKALAKEGK